MSRRGNCWDNAPQESFFGRMKDHIEHRVKECTKFTEVKVIIDGVTRFTQTVDFNKGDQTVTVK